MNNEGRLPRDIPHTFKASGTYIAPFDIYISPTFTWRNGRPYSVLYRPGETALNVKEVDGEERYDSQMNIDLRLEKAFVLMDKYRVGILIDAFNLLNDDAVDRYLSTYMSSSNFQVPSSIVDPRFYQVGIRLIF